MADVDRHLVTPRQFQSDDPRFRRLLGHDWPERCTRWNALAAPDTPPPAVQARERALGRALIVVAVMLLLGATFAIVGAKLLPDGTVDGVLAAIQDDRYYCLMVPLTPVPALIAVYFNWLSMKFFSSN